MWGRLWGAAMGMVMSHEDSWEDEPMNGDEVEDESMNGDEVEDEPISGDEKRTRLRCVLPNRPTAKL